MVTKEGGIEIGNTIRRVVEEIAVVAGS